VLRALCMLVIRCVLIGLWGLGWMVQGVHTSDMRRSKTFIHNREPTWFFEKGFTEDDELWTPMDRETADQQQARARSALVEIFNGDNSTCECSSPCPRDWEPGCGLIPCTDISVTSHSGETAGLLGALNHRPFPLDTGGESGFVGAADSTNFTPLIRPDPRCS
jgi:hypothetical protein